MYVNNIYIKLNQNTEETQIHKYNNNNKKGVVAVVVVGSQWARSVKTFAFRVCSLQIFIMLSLYAILIYFTLDTNILYGIFTVIISSFTPVRAAGTQLAV